MNSITQVKTWESSTSTFFSQPHQSCQSCQIFPYGYRPEASYRIRGGVELKSSSDCSSLSSLFDSVCARWLTQVIFISTQKGESSNFSEGENLFGIKKIPANAMASFANLDKVSWTVHLLPTAALQIIVPVTDYQINYRVILHVSNSLHADLHPSS